jgi:hypothetical protein
MPKQPDTERNLLFIKAVEINQKIIEKKAYKTTAFHTAIN